MNGDQSGSGQVYNVTITAIPDAATYTVGDPVMFICTSDSPVASTTVNVSYLWQCDDCFADGRTDMAFERILADMDTSMINCRVTIDNDVFMTDTPFDLQVTQGMVIHNTCIRYRYIYSYNMDLLLFYVYIHIIAMCFLTCMKCFKNFLNLFMFHH